jgi:hypothetical protein
MTATSVKKSEMEAKKVRKTAVAMSVVPLLITLIIFLPCASALAQIQMPFLLPQIQIPSSPPDNTGTSTSKDKVILAIMRSNYPDQNQLVSLYKPYLHSSDYVMTKPNYRNWDYALKLNGMKGVDYFSLADINTNAEKIKQKGGTFIGYDLEKQYSAPSDMANPKDAMTQASKTAHKYGLKLLAIPSHKLTDIYYATFAPLADIYGLQAQAYQPDPTQYKAYVSGIVPKLKSAHPGMPVITEVSTNQGTVSNMKKAFSSVADIVDGVTIWYSNTPADLSKVDQFLRWFDSTYR